MAECGVCWEIYEQEGAKCPKLLPCIHTVCVSCLKALEVNGNGKIRCPFCRILHQIPSGQIENLPTNQLELEKVTWKTNKIYTLPFSGKFLGADSGIGTCKVHNKPLLTVTYSAIDGTQQRFCETCLSLNSCRFPEREFESHTGHSMCFRQLQGPHGHNGTRNGEIGRVNNVSVPVQMINYEEFGQDSRPIWQTTRTINHVIQNVERTRNPSLPSNRNSNVQLARVLKMALFILCSPIFLSIGLSIVLVAIPTGVILSLFCLIYSCFRCRNVVNYTYQFIAKFTFDLFDKYAYLVARLFCWDVEDYNSRTNQMSQFMARVVFYVVMFLDSFIPFVGTVVLLGVTMYYMLHWL